MEKELQNRILSSIVAIPLSFFFIMRHASGKPERTEENVSRV